jgi:hypothetical protein
MVRAQLGVKASSGSSSLGFQGNLVSSSSYALILASTHNASSHLERHDAKFRGLLGSSLTFTRLMPVGTSFLDLLVPVLAGWGSSNRRIAASRYPGTVCDIPAGFVLRARLELENLIPRKLGRQPCRWAITRVLSCHAVKVIDGSWGQDKMVSSRLAT